MFTMKLHLFEFMDLSWLPSSLRATLREILECGNAQPFRPYYQWVADEVIQSAHRGGCQNVVELGAGTGPVTRVIAADPRSNGLRLIVCDNNPHREAYEVLQKTYPGKVFPRYDAVDFSQPQQWEAKTLLFLSATLHHVPPAARTAVFASLAQSSSRVMIFEPLRKTWVSIFFVLLSLVPAVILPIWFLGRPGKLRRFFWCWLIPLAPIFFLWDGIVSCLRQWTNEEWRAELQKHPGGAKEATVKNWLFCQMIAV